MISFWAIAALLMAAAADATPTKVFVLSGQSNMCGMGSIEHLRLLINESDYSCNTNEYKRLWNGTAFVERDDVYIQYNENMGKLTIGTGFGGSTEYFGPEVGFGWTVGDALNETVVIIKVPHGGRSLAVDFRPPASGEGSYSGVKPVHYGWEYRQMVLDILDGLDKLSNIYPDYDEAAGYELAGFVWFQGWNDVINQAFVNEYGYNLINFIRDVRLDLGAPGMPFSKCAQL
jgi:hypothetical protein